MTKFGVIIIKNSLPSFCKNDLVEKPVTAQILAAFFL